MTATSRPSTGATSENRLSLVTASDAAGATAPNGLRSTTADILNISDWRRSTTSRLSAASATRRSPASSAAGGMAVLPSSFPMSGGAHQGGEGAPPGYQRLRYRIIGAAPLVMHNGQLADPMNPIAREMKKVSGKRAKTEADYERLAELEFRGGLYLSGGEPCIPGENLEAVIIEGAKKMKRGPQARAGIISDGLHPLEYDGPRDADGLWSDPEFRLSVGVRVQKARVMRTRPIFRRWSAEVFVDFMPGQLNAHEIDEFMVSAGTVIGVCDWRPKFGRFTAERV